MSTAKASDLVKERILALVVEKTGYPQEMLDLDLDLEADLGIDTVKQAEMFASVRATFNIPRDENLKLRDYPTLASVIQFVRDNRPDLADDQANKHRPRLAIHGRAAKSYEQHLRQRHRRKHGGHDQSASQRSAARDQRRGGGDSPTEPGLLRCQF